MARLLSTTVPIINDLVEFGAGQPYVPYFVQGYNAKGDGSAGFFYWDPVSTETSDSMHIISASGVATGRWKRLAFLERKMTLGYGDPFTDDTKSLLVESAWNNAGITFTGIKYNVVNTASNVRSKLLDLAVGGQTRWAVERTGMIAGYADADASYFGYISGTGSKSMIWEVDSTNTAQVIAKNATWQTALMQEGASGKLKTNAATLVLGATAAEQVAIAGDYFNVTGLDWDNTASEKVAMNLVVTGYNTAQISSKLLQLTANDVARLYVYASGRIDLTTLNDQGYFGSWSGTGNKVFELRTTSTSLCQFSLFNGSYELQHAVSSSGGTIRCQGGTLTLGAQYSDALTIQKPTSSWNFDWDGAAAENNGLWLTATDFATGSAAALDSSVLRINLAGDATIHKFYATGRHDHYNYHTTSDYFEYHNGVGAKTSVWNVNATQNNTLCIQNAESQLYYTIDSNQPRIYTTWASLKLGAASSDRVTISKNSLVFQPEFTGGTTQNAFVSDVTDTSSAADSTVLQGKVGGATIFSVGKTGTTRFGVAGGAYSLYADVATGALGVFITSETYPRTRTGYDGLGFGAGNTEIDAKIERVYGDLSLKTATTAGYAPVDRVKITQGGRMDLIADAGKAESATLLFQEKDTTPSSPANGTEVKMYMKNNKLIIFYYDGTTKYRYLDLGSTNATWTYSDTEPA